MQTITDEYMQQMLMKTKEYVLVVLKQVPGASTENIQSTLWEHVRNNFSLRAEGLMPMVAPVTEERDIAGICIFNTDLEIAANKMKDDPAIKAGIFTYEVYPIRSFPGDSLPQ